MAKRNPAPEEIVPEKSPGLFLFFGDVTTELVQEASTWILAENLSDNPPDILTMMVNSPGGELSSAFALIEIMNGSRIPVRTIALGEAISAGLLISMSGKPGMRIVTPTCSIMSHHFSTGAGGSYHELMNVQKEFQFTDERILQQYIRCTGMSEAEVREKLIPNRDVWMSPAEAVAFNLFDEIRGIGV